MCRSTDAGRTDVISAQLAREYPPTNAKIGAEVVPLRSHLAGSMRDVLPGIPRRQCC